MNNNSLFEEAENFLSGFNNNKNINTNSSLNKEFNKDINNLNNLNNVNDDINDNITNNESNNLKNNQQYFNGEVGKTEIFLNYLEKLRTYGFPELGNISLSSDPKEQEKTYQFFEYIILKKITSYDDIKKYKQKNDDLIKKCEDLQSQIAKYEREVKSLKLDVRSKYSSKNEGEEKLKQQKEILEKQINSLRKDNLFLNNKINKIIIDKRNLEDNNQNLIEKLNKISINININNNKQNYVNSMDIKEKVEQNDLSKMLSNLNGAEKLLETLKGGYNESLRELLYEISALKNFIYDIHTELSMLIEYPEKFEIELLNISFLDTMNSIKNIFNKNFCLLKAKLGIDDNENINFYNLNNLQKK